jgi:hippurate hydrolase
LRELVEGTARAAGCTATLDYQRYYPATVNDAECARHALDAARELLGEATLAEAPAFTSEDFAFMLQKVPGAYVWLGQASAERPSALHTPGYDFNDNVLPLGAALLASIAERRLPSE